MATLFENLCQLLATGGCFFSNNPVTSTNATARHDMTEIALQVVLNTITLTLNLSRGVMPSSTVDRGFDCLYTKSLPWCDAVEYGRLWVRLSVH